MIHHADRAGNRLPPGRSASQQSALRVILNLFWLALAGPATLARSGVCVPPAKQLSARINRATWLLSPALVIGLALIGHGGRDWQAALAVGAVFAANGYNRHQFDLRGKRVAFGIALALGVVGIGGALGLPVVGSVAALLLVVLHFVWYRLHGD